MLNWLVSRIKSGEIDHRLGSDRAIDGYLATLPAADPQHTLAALEEWIDDPATLSAELPAALALHALARLDDFSQEAIEACWARYFQVGGPSYLSTVLLKQLQTHYVNLAGAYRHALALASAPESGEEIPKIRNALARIATRAMAALAEQKKITHFSYVGPDADWWQQAHELLTLARRFGILHIKQALHPGDSEPSSVWREYLIALQFETAPLSTLSRPQMALLDPLLRAIESSFVCVDAFSPQTPFRIRIDQVNGPSRCVPGQEDNPAWRYFGPGQARGHLIRIKAAIHSGKSPRWVPRFCEPAQSLALIDQLIMHWSINPPQRLKMRQPQKRALRVVNGFSQIRRMVSASEFVRSGRSLEYDTHLQQKELLRITLLGVVSEPSAAPVRTPLENLERMETAGDRQMTERWELIDRSERGLGTRYEFRRAWQEIGALVGYRFDDEIDWRVGIVRRLGRSHGKPNAGLTTFSDVPLGAQLDLCKGGPDCPWQQQTRDTSGHGFFDAILISRDEMLLLVPREVYSVDRRGTLLLGSERIPLQLMSLEASGPGYDLVRFRKAEASEASTLPISFSRLVK